MALGMSYEDFWHGESIQYAIYQKANEYRIKRRNEELWLQGLYIHNAFGVVISNAFSSKHKPEKYIEKPLELFEKSEEEKALERQRAQEKITERLKTLQADWQRRYGNQNKRT